MKALVTGATGYVGNNLCDRLILDGWEVSVILRQGGRALPDRWALTVTPMLYDGTTESLSIAMAQTTPDVVFHLASLFVAEHNADQVTDIVNSNVLFATQLAEAAVRTRVRHIINTGTSWQHFRSNDYDPVCLYAATKQAFEGILDFYSNAFGVTVSTVKLFDTYGPLDSRPKVMNLLLRTLRTGEVLYMSPGEQELDLVHVDDVTAAFIQCARNSPRERLPAEHSRFTISSGGTVTLKELVGLLERISGRKMNVVFGARPYRAREVMKPCRLGTPIPGWTPQIHLDVGLEQLVKYALRNEPTR